MARDCIESDSEEERHDRFRSERNSSSSLNASKSLFSTGLQPKIKSRSPLRRLNSPSRRDRKSPSKRSRSRSKRRSKERFSSKEKSKRESDKSHRRSTSKGRETRNSEGNDSRGEGKHRNPSKGSRRSRSQEKKRKRENRKSHHENVDQTNDTFLQRFERRRPSVENEIVENTVVYRDSTPEPTSLRKSHENKSVKKGKKKQKNSYGEAEEGELISEEENNCFGPALPPRIESEEDGEQKNSNSVAEGPALPPGFNSLVAADPVLSKRLCTRKSSTSQEEPLPELQKANSIGSEEDKRLPLIGPTLPPRQCLPPLDEDENGKEKNLYGPALPPQPSTSIPEEEEEIDDTLIGPLPKGMDDGVQRILEERAQLIRNQMENKESTDEGGNQRKRIREDWMIELPEVNTNAAHLGLGPRKFRTREVPDMSDRSSWTDTPGSKQENHHKDISAKEESRRLEISARNDEMERKSKQTSSHRDKSLLELHQKQMKKKKKKELENSGGKPERRPFSREIDLETNRFDEAKTKSFVKKAQLLDSRFSCGESKYL